MLTLYTLSLYVILNANTLHSLTLRRTQRWHFTLPQVKNCTEHIIYWLQPTPGTQYTISIGECSHWSTFFFEISYRLFYYYYWPLASKFSQYWQILAHQLVINHCFTKNHKLILFNQIRTFACMQSLLMRSGEACSTLWMMMRGKVFSGTLYFMSLLTL